MQCIASRGSVHSLCPALSICCPLPAGTGSRTLLQGIQVRRTCGKYQFTAAIKCDNYLNCSTSSSVNIIIGSTPKWSDIHGSRHCVCLMLTPSIQNGSNIHKVTHKVRRKPRKCIRTVTPWTVDKYHPDTFRVRIRVMVI